MTDKEFDDLFKQPFSEHEMPVPHDMWQRIQPEEKKRRGAFLVVDRAWCGSFVLYSSAQRFGSLLHHPVKM